MHTIEVVNGILVRRLGLGAGKKLLCLHGFADNGLAFLPLCETALPNYFELVLVDLPGFGASPSIPGFGLVRDYARLVAGLAAAFAPEEPVGLIGHSIGSAIAVTAADLLSPAPLGLFSIEGNLTEDDAYFSGKAADWQDSKAFKAAFLEEIWELAAENVDLRRYYGGVEMARAEAMWTLGRDAKRISAANRVGQAFRAMQAPNLYYWGETTTPPSTRQYIEEYSIPNRRYPAASHWPMIADPQATASAVIEFFNRPTG